MGQCFTIEGGVTVLIGLVILSAISCVICITYRRKDNECKQS